MTQAKNMFVIEVDFFREDRRFLSLSWSSKIVYIAMWCNAFHERKEMTQWRSRDHLVAQLHLWTDAPMEIVSNAIDECCSGGLTSFDGHALTVYGVAAKHTTIQRWYNTVDAPLGTDGIGRPIRGKKTSQTGKQNTPNLPVNGRQIFPEPEPEREPLRPPLPPKAVDEFPTSEEGPEEEACVCDTEEDTEDGEEEEIRQFLCDLARTYEDPSLQGCDFKFRQLVLRRRFNFGSARVEAQVLRCGRERLLAAAYYALTRARSSPEGTLHEYACKRGNVPDSETIHRKVKEMLYGVRQ